MHVWPNQGKGTVDEGALEWLLTNREGSFAMGCADRIPRRKYHSLLTARETGSGEPWSVLAEVAETLRLPNGETFLFANFPYTETTYPDGRRHLKNFTDDPEPRWQYEAGGIIFSRVVRLSTQTTAVRILYRFSDVPVGSMLVLQPWFTVRPYHTLTHENALLNGEVQFLADGVSFHPYRAAPRIFLGLAGTPTAEFRVAGQWNRGVVYAWERERGYEFAEDYYSPGTYEVTLDRQTDIVFVVSLAPLAETTFEAKPVKRPQMLAGRLERAAHAYLIRRHDGFHSVVAGYPWFGEWGRDTFISLPGLCLSRGDLDTAEAVLTSHAGALVDGLVPNVMATGTQRPNLNAADASLLFIRAVELFSQEAGWKRTKPLLSAVFTILDALKSGRDTRQQVTPDGGLYLAPGPWALTWMDAIMNGQPVTPRHGFPVDINALFLHAMRFAIQAAQTEGQRGFVSEWEPLLKKARFSFAARYISLDKPYLADGHDGMHPDWRLRPNQLWALALPEMPVPPTIAQQALATIEARLLTPVGLRTLDPDDPDYHPHYGGNQAERDCAYHQGSVWPWLLGLYADALQRHLGTAVMRRRLRPILARLAQHLMSEGCIGHISELFDADPPHKAGGAPAQAWSVAETLRIAKRVRQ